VLALADRVTVLRDGVQVITDDAAAQTPQSLVRLMVGRDVQALARRPEPVEADAPVVFQARGLTNATISDVSLEVRRGEIVGLAGLVGSGRTETLRAIFGADRLHSGEISVEGRPLRSHSVPAAIARGIALVPESRKDEGLVLGRGATENVALATLGRRQVAGVVRGRVERRVTRNALALVDVRGSVHRVPVRALSGGNQQKAMFAKWLVEPPAVLLIDEPTRGVDIAAKVNIHNLVLDLAARGTAVVVVSSDLEEVMALSHRLVVLRRGRVCAEFRLPADRQEIMSAAFEQESAR
jgi:ABC-type sugar transport system ATPase subunit